MRYHTLLIILLLSACSFCSLAQTPATKPQPNSFRVNENTVVKDSSGAVLPFTDWKNKLMSRQYNIRRKDVAGKEPEFIIYKLTEAEQKRLAAMLAAKQANSRDTANNVKTAAVPVKPAESLQFKIGDIFKPFKDKDINGEKFDLKKMPGKVFVINFWFIGCPPCRAEIPDLNKIVERYKDNKDVVFIAIALDMEEDIKHFLQYIPYNYHIIENGRYIAEKYGVHLYPTNLIVDKEGKIAYSSVSNQSANPYWMTKTIDEALSAPFKTETAAR